jgi:prevent-host-death family protein
MVMIRVNVYEVKAKLSEYLDRASRGERIVICRHNKPVAELRPIADLRAEARPVGPLPGRPTFDVSEEFFEPLSASELALWDGLAPSNDPPSFDRREPRNAPSRASEGTVPVGRVSDAKATGGSSPGAGRRPRTPRKRS